MSDSSSFDWGSFLTVAKRLASRSEDNEAELRSAISRAYYAAYHGARLLLITLKGNAPSGPGSHGKLWKICKKECGNAVRPIGHKGANLKVDREDADYEDIFPDDLEVQARHALIDAKFILDETSRIRELRQQ